VQLDRRPIGDGEEQRRRSMRNTPMPDGRSIVKRAFRRGTAPGPLGAHRRVPRSDARGPGPAPRSTPWNPRRDPLSRVAAGPRGTDPFSDTFRFVSVFPEGAPPRGSSFTRATGRKGLVPREAVCWSSSTNASGKGLRSRGETSRPRSLVRVPGGGAFGARGRPGRRIMLGRVPPSGEGKRPGRSPAFPGRP